ncbi:hypothetical protein WN55_00579 [Dufourea novaeangliae]|uniref:Uncharacterized protein n=1 Tax=Dufourea novaeangliae TaxID=178035 RepID=A0A154PDK6_DUFNO|nr:hypothetical protein WN55_00579 [Dufourea novaeangliae]
MWSAVAASESGRIANVTSCTDAAVYAAAQPVIVRERPWLALGAYVSIQKRRSSHNMAHRGDATRNKVQRT